MNLKTIIFVFGALVLLATLASGQSLPYNKLDKLKVNDLVAKKLEVQSTTQSSLPCPSMTQVQRDAIATPTEGSCVYNSDTNVLNIYDGSAWVEVGSGGGGAGGIANWETAKFYEVGDVVIESNKIYQANTQHTSSVFASDIAYWTQIANNVSDVTGVLPMANGGTDKNLTPVLGGVVYTDAGSMEILGAGTTGQFLKSNGAAAPSWEDVVVNDSSFSGLLSLSKGGTNKNLSAEDGAILYLDADSVEKLSPGTSGQVLQSNGSGAPSFANKSISAKSENGSSVTLEEIQVSNNLLTQTDTNKHLIESGNNNILVNPSFEHSTFSTGWTNTNGVFAEDTIVELHGKKAAKVTLTSQALSLHQDSTLYQAQFADGVQGLASVRVKTSVSGIKVCSKQAGIITSNLCVDVQANNKWGLYKVPFILGGTSNGISINSNSTNVTGDVYIDDAFVGATDLITSFDASKIAGKSWFLSGQTVSATGYTSFSGTPAPNVEYSNLGTWATTSSSGYKQVITNLPAGCYKHEWTGTFGGSNIGGSYKICASVNGVCSNSSQVGEIQPSTASFPMHTSDITCFNSNQSSVDFSLFGAASAGTITSTLTPPIFKLTYYSSGNTYSSTNANTDWQSCTPGSIQGFASPTYNIQCKRDGSDLLMKGRFSFTTVSAVEARLGLPVWNGVQLVSAGTSKISALEVANGFYVRSTASTEKGGSILIAPSISYFAFGSAFTFSGSSVTSFGTSLATSVSAGNENISFNARIPIEGWQNSNIIIGQFNGLESCTNTLECTDTFSAKISSAGVVSDENVSSFINGNCTKSSTGQYSCPFVSGTFTVAPNCVVTKTGSSIQTVQAGIESVSNSSIGVSVAAWNIANPYYYDAPFTLTCQKQGVDYIGKTAKAVASDQNVSTPGTIKSTLCSAKISSTGVISDQKGGCFSSCTNATTPVCTFTSSYWVSTPNCWVIPDTLAALAYSSISGTTSFSGFVTNTAGTPVAGARLYFCHGERQ